MRAFIILGFLVAASCAGSTGYNYGPGKSGNLDGSASSLVGTIGLAGSGGLGGSSYNSGGYGSGLIGGGSQIIGGGSKLISGGGSTIIGGGNSLIGGGSGLIGGGSTLISGGGSRLIGGGSTLIGGGSGLIGGGSTLIGGGSGLSSGRTTNVLALPSLDSIPQTVEYSKQYFHFEAPEEIQEEGVVTKQLSNVLKKNQQVIFIKAPENNAATNAALQLAKQAIEQRTSIYVLSKQNDGAQLVGQLQQIQESVPTTPDVKIVKYRTPQDLNYAKEIITSQYESQGGSSESYNGGVVPVLNYASGSGYGSGYGTSLGSTNIIGGGLGSGSILGSNLGSTQIIRGGSVYGTGSSLGSGLGSSQIIGGGSLLGSGYGSTGSLYGGSGNYGLGNYGLSTNQVNTVVTPGNSQYLPPLKKK